MRQCVALVFAAALVVAGGCSSKSDSKKTKPAAPAKGTAKTSPKKPTATKPTPTKPAPGTRGSATRAAYFCRDHVDCMNSCSQGAVGTRWYRHALPGGESCEDGCASKTAGPPKCLDNQCVAFDTKGKEVAACTRIAGKVESPGPAHKCVKDSDCKASCRYGAINKAWYKAHAKPECKDGCTRKGTGPPKCEKGTCINYFQGKRDSICTKRAIWN